MAVHGCDGRPFFILKLVSLLVLFFVVTAGVVFITKGQRRIPIQNARTVRGTGSQRHYMPIKVNSAGVLPIIFAQSLLIIPGVILNYFEGTQEGILTCLQQAVSGTTSSTR